MSSRLLIGVIGALIASCGGGGSSAPAGGSGSSGGASGGSPPPLAQKPFWDVTSSSNIEFVVGITTPYGTSSDAVANATFGGVAAGDCDNDGDIDLFVTYGDHGSPATSPNQLYLNQLNLNGSGLAFVEVATGAIAYTHDVALRQNDRHSGPTFADMDGDGDLDLFLGGLFGDPNRIFRNRGDCTFDDVTDNSPDVETLAADNTISAAFGDYDLDGDLDMFLTHWGNVDDFPVGAQSEHLFMNVSDGGGIRFENVSGPTGVSALLVSARHDALGESADSDFTYTPTFARINNDLWPDLALASDFGTAQLLLNNLASSGEFIDGTNDAVRTVRNGMGSALGDYDDDGDLDWFVTSIYATSADDGSPPIGNRFYRNPGGDFATNQFEDVTDSVFVADGGWGWGACFLDIDNDADLDIYHTNGWNVIYRGQDFNADRSRLFESRGPGTTFHENAFTFGLNDDNSGRAVVCADFDNDGDIDIFQLTDDETNSATLWENASAAAGNNFLRFKLIGMPPNTEAVGARIHVTIDGHTQMREIMIGSNYTSQNPTVQVFGLGDATQVDSLRVEWPALLTMSGPEQPADWTRNDVHAGVRGQTLLICHPEIDPAPAVCSLPD